MAAIDVCYVSQTDRGHGPLLQEAESFESCRYGFGGNWESGNLRPAFI